MAVASYAIKYTKYGNIYKNQCSAQCFLQVHVFPKASLTSIHTIHKPMIVNTSGFLNASVLLSSTSALPSRKKVTLLCLCYFSQMKGNVKSIINDQRRFTGL